MKRNGLLYFALGVATVISLGAVTNQIVPLTATGISLSDTGVTFSDGTVQTTASPKFISLNVYADPGLNWDERFADLNDAGVGGINLDVDFNFTIPPDYTTGTPMTIRVLAYAKDSTTFPCFGELSANWVYAARADVGEISDGHTSLQPQDIQFIFAAADVPKEYQFSLDSSTDLQAGDTVGFGLSGFGPATRCALVITGISVHYQ